MEPSLREVKKHRTRKAITAAALELFAAQGFESVTMAAIADAADIGERTLFRYFPDKEELLFDGDAAVLDLLRASLADRPAHEAHPTVVVEAVLGLAPMWQERHAEGRARQAVIDASPALKARERAKHTAYEHTLVAGLAARGAPAPQARLLARVAVACIDEALTRWFADDDPARPGLAGRGREAFTDLARHLGAPG